MVAWPGWREGQLTQDGLDIMLGKIAVGLCLICVTTVIQGAFMLTGVRYVEWRAARRGHVRSHIFKELLVSEFTAWMFIGMLLEALIWALFYLYNPALTALSDLETALYFSMVTFTSVGYGDVVIAGDWRILASLEGANGVIIFGWTTALIFYVIQHLYRPK